jgi:hypothetical protein
MRRIFDSPRPSSTGVLKKAEGESILQIDGYISRGPHLGFPVRLNADV